MAKVGEPLKTNISDSGFDRYLTRPFEGLGEANREFEEQTGYSYADLVAGLEGAKIQGFTTTIAFSSTDYRVVTWAAGTISYQDGLVTPEIATSNTGNMAARTYIYYDPQASKVALATTTTAATATQGERLLLAIATPNANTAGMASIEVFGATGTYVANLSVEHLTAGSIRSKTVTLAVTAGTGDCYFNAGKTDFTNTDSGFILGLDDSDSDKAKFYIGDATEYLNWDGSNLTIAGILTATSGAIGGWTINSTSIYTGTEDHSGYTANAGDITIYSSGTDASIHAKNWYIDTSGNLTCQSATIGGSTITTPTITGIQTGSEIAIQGWQHDLVFSVTDADTVAWASGTITLMNGDTYSIDAGDTSDMSATTYVYLGIATSITVLQTTTTPATAVGTGKILVATAKNSTNEALFQVFGGIGGIKLAGGDIENLTIAAGQLASNAVEEAKVSADAITATKIAVSGLDGATGDVAADHIVAGMIQTNAITSVKIQADAVTATKINVVGLDGATGRILVADATDANVVTGGINTYATTLIGAGKILVSGSTVLSDWSHVTDATLIDGGDIYTNTITATQIAATTITASEIAANTITANEIGANVITTSEVQAGGINVDRLAAGTILSKAIVLGITGGTGDSYIAANKRDFYNSTTIGVADTQFDITNPSGTTFRYTFDDTGTDPDIDTYIQVGTTVVTAAQNFNAANNSTFTATGVGAKYFEVTNASGVAENNVTIGTGSITVSDSGFILGLDDSDSDKGKFYIGDSSKYLNWDGADLTIQGLVKDGSGKTIIDATGLVGSASFTSSVVSKDDDQALTGDYVWQDISDLTFDITLTRTTPVLFFGMIAWKVSGSDAGLVLRIDYGGSLYPTSGNGWHAINYRPDAVNSGHEFTLIHILNIPTGTTTVTLQGARSTPDETVTVLGLDADLRSTFGHVILGT